MGSVKTPGEQAKLAAMDAARNMSVLEYAKMRHRSRNTVKRLRNGQKLGPRGFQKVMAPTGSFGDTDYGR